MASPSRLSGLLQRFRLDGVRDTGITVGDGAYATVLQYDFRGLKCVGKKIQRLLYEQASPAQRADMLQRFEEECELLGQLHHPNIVQFLGVHVETGSELPVLVMEYLPTNLSYYLDRHGVLPTEISYGILRDVALGLRYLHEYSPPIVHRDLSANNVLLTASLSAKISDFGVAKFLNITSSQMTQQISPGTPCYMPPEAFMARPKYTRKIDSYSFGVMILHVLCGEWPFPTDFQPAADHDAGTVVPVNEVDRRAEFLLKIGRDHPLSGLVRQCLSNAPNQRPESADILQQINTALSQVPTPAETVFQQLESLRSENQRLERENQKLKNEEHSQTQPSGSGAAVNQPMTQYHEVERLSVRDLDPPVRAATNSTESQVERSTLLDKLKRLFVSDSSSPAKDSTESQLHPGVRLQWRRCADAPVGMSNAEAVVVGEKVYVGGGLTASSDDAYQVFQYNRRGDTWSTLPHCLVKWFGMVHFMGRTITVGGRSRLNHSSTNEIYSLREESQQWEKFLIPMPTARYFPSLATTSVAIIAAGGISSRRNKSSAVEVYSSDTSQWHTADPLPKPCAQMSSVTVNNVWYLLGGTGTDQTSFVKDCWCAPLDSIVHKAVLRSASGSVWSYLPPTPFKASTAACLSGSLVTVGGKNDDMTRSSAVYGFINSLWVRLSNGDLPAFRSSCTTAQLSPVEVIVIGGWGWDEQDQQYKTVFIGTQHL